MTTITNREFSDKTNHDYHKVRRWSRDLFGIDSTAGQASGKAREYEVDDAFLFYLGSVLISRQKVSIPNTKKIIEKLEPWLKEHNLFPLSPKNDDDWKFKADGRELDIHDWIISARFYDSGDLCLTVKAQCHQPWETEGAPGRIGKRFGMALHKEYNLYAKINDDCSGLVVNSVNISIDGLLSEFKYFFGI